jgi:hypothetical protein
MFLDLPFKLFNLKYNPMKSSINSSGANPLYNNKRTADAGADMSGSDVKQSEVRADGTGSNHSLPTDGPLRQNIEDSTKLTDNDVEDPGVISSGNLPGDDEEGDEDELFDDDFEVDGDSDDLNADIDDDDLDTLDGPLLDENNPRH